MNFANVAANLREQFRIIAASHAAGEVREYSGVSIASSAVAFNMFNAAFLSGPIPNQAALEQRILLASAYFQTRNLGWAFWVCEDFMTGWTRRRSRRSFERFGLRHSVDLPGMIAPAINPPTRDLPALDVRRVAPGADRDAFCAIGSLCFNVPPAWFQEVFADNNVWENFAAYVGYADGEPVATAAVICGGGALGVYNVATAPGYRHKGYAEVIVRAALDDVRTRTPLTPVILQSTPAGLHLYERMGFRTASTIAVYSTH